MNNKNLFLVNFQFVITFHPSHSHVCSGMRKGKWMYREGKRYRKLKSALYVYFVSVFFCHRNKINRWDFRKYMNRVQNKQYWAYLCRSSWWLFFIIECNWSWIILFPLTVMNSNSIICVHVVFVTVLCVKVSL